MDVKAPYLPYDTIRERAESFLREYHGSRTIPVPIEEIIEFQFQMDIVPVPGLHENFDIDAYISADLTQISVDEYVYLSRPGRYRFSLAHELAHRILHRDVFSCLTFDSIGQWKRMLREAIPEREYSFLEYHANSFAGLVLAPSSELVQKFEDVRAMLETRGISLPVDSDVARESIASHIAEHFVVSPAVIDRRLKYDGLW